MEGGWEMRPLKNVQFRSMSLLLKRITIIIALNYEAKGSLKCIMYGKIQTGQSLAGKVMH